MKILQEIDEKVEKELKKKGSLHRTVGIDKSRETFPDMLVVRSL